MSLRDTNDRSMVNMQRGGTYTESSRACRRANCCPSKWARWRISTTCTPRLVRDAQRIDLFGTARPATSCPTFGKISVLSAWNRVMPTVRQGLAHGQEVLRRIDLVPVVRGARFRLRCRAGREPVQWSAGAAHAQERCIRLRPGMCRSEGQLFWHDCDGNWVQFVLVGNGGADPVHAELFATDIDEDTVLMYLDRYLICLEYLCLLVWQTS
jgi:nitrite reductase (NADH) large subunit